MASANKPSIDPKDEWQTLETTVEDPTPYLDDFEALHRDYYPRVHSRLIGKMERLVQAIVMQFTLGGHADPLGEMKSLVIVYSEFLKLQDSEFGTVDYRRSVEILKQDQDNWVARSDDEIARSHWPTRVVTKVEFRGDWPFRHERVIIECRQSLFCVVNVNGYAFALNGSARSRFRFPDPHEAGVAILGKSIGPFIEMTFALAPNSPVRHRA